MKRLTKVFLAMSVVIVSAVFLNAAMSATPPAGGDADPGTSACKGRSKTVARGGRGNFVALLANRSRSFGWIGRSRWDGGLQPRRREPDRSVYGHGTLDGRSTGGVG